MRSKKGKAADLPPADHYEAEYRKRRAAKSAPPAAADKPADRPKSKLAKISEMLMARMKARRRSDDIPNPDPAVEVNPFVIPAFPPGVKPKDPALAMDSVINESYKWAASLPGGFTDGQRFMGYTYLSQLAQRPEYRVMSETIATEMTRKWITFQSVASEEVEDDDNDPALEDALSSEPDADDDTPDGENPTDQPSEGDTPAPDDIGSGDPLNPEADQPTDTPEGGSESRRITTDDAFPKKPGAEPDDGPKAGAGGSPFGAAPSAGDPGNEPDAVASANEPDPEEEAAKQAETEKTERIKAVEDEMKRLGVRDAFRRAAEHDGFFGRGHIFIDLGTEDPDELKMPIGDGRDEVSKAKIGKGSLKGLRNIEPLWCYPMNYNASNPLSPDWYKPKSWNVNGIEVHSSRLLTFVGREVPDILKPAYAFGGLSMSQMAKPYVDNWLRTRKSVSDLISSFSVSGIKTDLLAALQAEGDDLMKRADLFIAAKDNKNLMILDKETEDFFNVTTNLSTLDNLQAQTQEHMASVSRIPLVKLLGIQPAGLNASSEGELRAFYDWIKGFQELLYRVNLTIVISIIQLSLFGEVDPDLTFDFEPLWSLDAGAEATMRKTEMDTDMGYVDGGVLHPEEIRKKIATDPDSPYKGIDVNDMPEPPPPEIPLGPDGLPLSGAPPAPGEEAGGGDKPHSAGGPTPPTAAAPKVKAPASKPTPPKAPDVRSKSKSSSSNARSS